MADTKTEEDPGYHAQWRCKDWSPHAYNTIRHAQQIKASQEAHVLLLRGMPEARRSGQASPGVDSGLVRRRMQAPAGTCADRRSNAIRFDLQAPNEYVRGNTLRFV